MCMWTKRYQANQVNKTFECNFGFTLKATVGYCTMDFSFNEIGNYVPLKVAYDSTVLGMYQSTLSVFQQEKPRLVKTEGSSKYEN